MASDVPAEITSILQSASINRHPSPRHDINPSTVASEKQPVRVDAHPDPDSLSDVGEDEIPTSVLHPVPRRQNMPPLPDLRFEQSYLKSIERAESWKGVLWITMRDQVCIEGMLLEEHRLTAQVIMCFAQGVIWNIILHGWRHWNHEAKFSGRGVGARIRRWWWGVNNWTIPADKGPRLSNKKLAKNVSEYYKGEFSSAAQD
ncbi:DUF1770-domain-containing protein [Lentithecium fluviatile CBS 122367]|uniref:DUF1770-domain-containing protein n=1 Tax=Lentithecium fluviatile CBS 122367 TaxID=1168545 RepID=A0A6G1IIE4_9PLEO|nr:DUF1770-domain-containing protein [Lentithecium fluviatile CBS 122367]